MAGYIRIGGEMLDYRSPVSAQRHERVRGDYTLTVNCIIPRLDTLTRPNLHAEHLPLPPDRYTHMCSSTVDVKHTAFEQMLLVYDTSL